MSNGAAYVRIYGFAEHQAEREQPMTMMDWAIWITFLPQATSGYCQDMEMWHISRRWEKQSESTKNVKSSL